MFYFNQSFIVFPHRYFCIRLTFIHDNIFDWRFYEPITDYEVGFVKLLYSRHNCWAVSSRLVIIAIFSITLSIYMIVFCITLFSIIKIYTVTYITSSLPPKGVSRDNWSLLATVMTHLLCFVHIRQSLHACSTILMLFKHFQ